MAPGADKVIFFDPPGAIGLIDKGAVVQLRLNETATEIRPKDDAGSLGDLDVDASGTGSLAMPQLVSAVLGRGRLFSPVLLTGIGAKDLDSGASLLTRDATIQVVLGWNAAEQSNAGAPGTIVCRGLGSPSAEYISYGLRLAVVDAPSFTASVRWFWQDTAGVARTQTGADVTILPGQFTMLTATRRWVSPTEVLLRYYVGDQLIGEVTSVDGSIGGGTTGTLLVGSRLLPPVVDLDIYAGIIDELMVIGRELTHEEIEATWLRITRYQPLGYQLIRELIDPGFPAPDRPESDVQKDLRMLGFVLGMVASGAENIRNNFLPGRAYGDVLAKWVEALHVTPKPPFDVDTQRARALARLRQKNGISIEGLEEALVSLVDCDVDDLEFIAYDNTVRDSFDSAVDPILWDMSPTGCAALNSGHARMAPGAGDYSLTNSLHTWLTMARTVSQPVLASELSGIPQGGEQAIGKIVFTTPQNNVEVGVWVGDRAANNYLLIGLKQDGVFRVVTEGFISGVSQGLVIQETLGGNPAAIWLRLQQLPDTGEWSPQHSVTSGTTGFSVGAAIPHPARVHWAGFYLRGVAGAGPVVDFDDFVLWTPSGTRPFNAYVLRDAGLGGAPDLEGAHSVIRAIKHGFTHATIITSRALLCDDLESMCDRGPMGAL